MSREIKFRVWNRSEESGFIKRGFITDCCIGQDGEILRWIDGEYRPLSSSDLYGEDIEVQQFTGFKDLHGKEIYDGDILKHTLGIILGEVYWDEIRGQWKLTKQQGGNTPDWFSYYEIAGNIFENKELL